MDTAVVAMNTAPLATGEPVFRFYDNRQKYLLFVNTCSEKWVVAQRVAMELGNIYPRPPAIRIFDAGGRRRHCADARDARYAPAMTLSDIASASSWS